MAVPGTVAAGMGKRLGAFAVDVGVYLLAVGLPLAVAYWLLLNDGPVEDPSAGVLALFGLGYGLAVVVLVFQAWYEARYGFTVGKTAVGIRLVSVDTGEPLGVGRVLLRWLVVLLGALVVGIGALVVWLSPLWDVTRRRRGWQDQAAGAEVLDIVQGTDPMADPAPDGQQGPPRPEDPEEEDPELPGEPASALRPTAPLPAGSGAAPQDQEDDLDSTGRDRSTGPDPLSRPLLDAQGTPGRLTGVAALAATGSVRPTGTPVAFEEQAPGRPRDAATAAVTWWGVEAPAPGPHPGVTVQLPTPPTSTGSLPAVPPPPRRPATGPLPTVGHPAPPPTPAVRPATGPIATVRPATGPIAMGRPVTGPVPAVRPATGPLPTVRPATGPLPPVRPATGPLPTVRPATGPIAMGRPVTGPLPAVRPATGPIAVGAAVGSTPMPPSLPAGGPVPPDRGGRRVSEETVDPSMAPPLPAGPASQPPRAGPVPRPPAGSPARIAERGMSEDFERTDFAPPALGPGDGPQSNLEFFDGRRIELREAALVGRNPETAIGEPPLHLIQVADRGRSVSKTHLMIGVDDRGLWVEDCRSTNGTMVTLPGGQQIVCAPYQRVRVPVGGVVRFGDAHFAVRG